MCLRGIRSFLRTPPGAPGESDLRFPGQEYIDLSSPIPENCYNSKVNSLVTSLRNQPKSIPLVWEQTRFHPCQRFLRGHARGAPVPL